MSTDPKQPDKNERRPQRVSQDALDDALNRLEGMLARQHVVAEEEPAPEPQETAVPEPEPLPLLDEVVIPGDLLEEEASEEPPERGPIHLETVPAYADLLSRLASELDIIIESCVDEALAQAKQDLLLKIKNHLDIVLPEILDEMSRRQADGQD
jgi:hypothetical protein